MVGWGHQGGRLGTWRDNRTRRGVPCCTRAGDTEGMCRKVPGQGGDTEGATKPGGGGSTSGCPHLAVPPRDPVVPQLMLTAVLNCLFDSLSQMLRYDGSWGGTEAPGGHPLS